MKPGVSVITPNPKTSGGARWNYLAAWGYALKKWGGDEAKARDFVARLFKNVPILDTGARGATTTFVQRGIGDVLVAWENEALLAVKESDQGGFEIVDSLGEHPGRAAGDVGGQGGQQAGHARRGASLPGVPVFARRARKSPRSTTIGRGWSRSHAKYAASFPKVELFTIDEVFGGWQKAQKTHFAEGGVFDQIQKANR